MGAGSHSSCPPEPSSWTAVHGQSCAASRVAAGGGPRPAAWPQTGAMLQQTVMDGSSADLVIYLRARTTPRARRHTRHLACSLGHPAHPPDDPLALGVAALVVPGPVRLGGRSPSRRGRSCFWHGWGWPALTLRVSCPLDGAAILRPTPSDVIRAAVRRASGFADYPRKRLFPDFWTT